MQFRVLGAFEVLDDGQPLDLGHHKQKALLALLLINANRVVSTDRILEEIWGEDAAGKENALWVYISRIRAALPAQDVLVTKDHGYSLVVEPDSIDAHRFESASQRGRELLHSDPASAADTLRDGLDLWRGSAYEDFAFDDFARLESGRLEEMRLAATEDRIDADLRAGASAEVVAELEALLDQHPYRERLVEKLMLALYRAGRQADALRTFERFRRGIGEELGLEPSPELRRLEEQVLLHDTRLQPSRVARPRAGAVVAANPFKGLRPFEEDDAEHFFGREKLVADIVRRLTDGQRLIALVGPSGSGKSSVVRAGLIPAIRKGAVPGSDEWLIARMVPGSHPFAELEAALLWSTLDGPDSLTDQLEHDDAGLLRSALQLLPSDRGRLLLIIDQFEELFTLVDEEEVRRRFLANLGVALDDSRGRVVVTLTMRADFYERPLAYPDFGSRLGSGIVNVVALSPDELEAAALEPARRAGVTLEPQLLAELLTDVIGQPGGLPLFQYALTELFDRRVGDTLAVASYRSMGGVRGVLTKRAEEIFTGLDAESQAVAKQLFLRLVSVTEDGQWTRRRVAASEVTSLDVDVVTLQEVIDAFGNARLLSFDRDQVTGNPTVEVAHEALLTEWDRLNGWIDQHRDDVRHHAVFTIAMREWHEAGRDESYLITGGRLDRYEAWSRTATLQLTAPEQEFLDASLDRRRVDREAELARSAEQERLRRSSRRRTWGLTAAIGLLVGVIAIVVIVFTRPEGPRVALMTWEREGTGSVIDLLSDGWDDAVRELDFEAEKVIPLVDPDEDLRQLADSGVDLVIVEIFDRSGFVAEVAAEYPDTHFVVFDEEPVGDNMTSIEFVREGGAYLMGVAAALQSETNQIGFIGGLQQQSTEARRASFTQGARSVNPDIAVRTVYLGPFEDVQGFDEPDMARQAATDLYTSGVDVIHHSAGNSARGIVEAAVELSEELDRPLWVIGSETNEYFIRSPAEREHILTSMHKRWDSAIYAAIEAFLTGDLVSGYLEFDIDSDMVSYSTAGGYITSHVSALEEVQSRLVDGSLVPTGAADEPPAGWSRSVTHTGTVTFTGDECSYQIPGGMVARDILRLEIVNRSQQDVGLSVDGGGPLLTTWTSPGASNAIAVVGSEGDWEVFCFTDDGPELEGHTFRMDIGGQCDMSVPGVDPADPLSVVRALEAAINAGDRDAVCSLLSVDATFVEGGNRHQDREAFAEDMTPNLDGGSTFFGGATFSDLTVVGDVVTFNAEYVDVHSTERVVGHQVTIRNGQVVQWIFGEWD